MRSSRSGHHLRLSAFVIATVCALLPASVTLAHMETPVTPENVWRSWNFDPLIVLPLLALAGLYVSGVRSIWSRSGRGEGITTKQVAAFTGGMLALVIALVTPIDQLGGALFSVHMVQHLLLTVVAAPLLVYAAPLAPLLVALPRNLRRRAGRISGHRASRAAARLLTNPFFVWWAHAVALWVWHTPALYEAALRNRWIHMLEHAAFFGTAMLFWWLVIQPYGRRTLGLGISVLFIFTTMAQSTALGALITFAPSHWYEAHAPYTSPWGISPLVDQQLAGLIMWIPGGLVYLGAGLTAFLYWMKSMEPATA